MRRPFFLAQNDTHDCVDTAPKSSRSPFFRRNLLHHRSARAECPYTRSIMISPLPCFVNYFFRKNHKIFHKFSALSQILKSRFIEPCIGNIVGANCVRPHRKTYEIWRANTVRPYNRYMTRRLSYRSINRNL